MHCTRCEAPDGPSAFADRATLLGQLEAGDVVCARTPGGAHAVCRVLAADADVLQLREVVGGRVRAFDRRTGAAITRAGEPAGAAAGEIVSVAPLTVDLHNAVLALDRRSRLAQGGAPVRLTCAEQAVLLLLDEHYQVNPL